MIKDTNQQPDGDAQEEAWGKDEALPDTPLSPMAMCSPTRKLSSVSFHLHGNTKSKPPLTLSSTMAS